MDVQLPWHYPTPAEFTRRLVAAGFTPSSVELIPRPTPLPSGMAAWLRTFAGRSSSSCRRRTRAAFDEVMDLLRWSLCDEQGQWTADYVRLRFEAIAT